MNDNNTEKAQGTQFVIQRIYIKIYLMKPIKLHRFFNKNGSLN